MNQAVKYIPGKSLDEHKREIVRSALAFFDGNRSETARALGVCVRTMRGWINRWNLREEFPPVGVYMPPFHQRTEK